MINYLLVGKDRDTTLAVLQALRSFTDASCMVIGNRENRAVRWSSLCKQQATVDFGGADDDYFISLVNSLTRFTRHMVLIPLDCSAIRMVNRVERKLAINIAPIPDTPTLSMLDDRWRFLRLCRQHGIAVAPARLLGGEAEPEFPALSSELGLPFVVKGLNHSSGLDPVPVQCRRDLWKMPARGLLLAQSVIEGFDAGVSLLADRGQLNAFAIQSSRQLSAEQEIALEAMARRVCHVCAFCGVMLLKARIDIHTGAVLLVDCVPHFWPDVTLSILAGLNLVAECVQPSSRMAGVQRVRHPMTPLAHPLSPGLWARLHNQDEAGRLLRTRCLDLYSLTLATRRSVRALLRRTDAARLQHLSRLPVATPPYRPVTPPAGTLVRVAQVPDSEVETV